MKDVPDIKGDLRFGIRTFSVRLGPRFILNICTSLLYIMYGLAAGFFAAFSKRLVFQVLMPLAHVGVAGLLAFRARKVDATQAKSVYGLYMFVWKLFYLEYLFLPLAVL